MRREDRGLVGRAITAFVVMPGMVAGVVPAWLARHQSPGAAWPLGLLLLATGLAGLLWCVRDFFVRGRGTLAPWSPPEALVETGLYRYSRNPMYVAVVLMLAGWLALFTTRSLLEYGSIVALAFVLRVHLGEEPYLAREFGEKWERYRRRVPRWLGPRHTGDTT